MELGKALLSDQKNLSEHGFVVSMIRQVLEPFCNGLNVPGAPVLMRMRDIQHLYTPVTGTVKDKNTTLFQLVKALHPTPALGGIPRQPAMEAIRLLEKMNRGLYGAPIGWVDYRGSGEFCVGIRSGLLGQKFMHPFMPDAVSLRNRNLKKNIKKQASNLPRCCAL